MIAGTGEEQKEAAMARFFDILSRVKLVYKRTNNLTKVVILCAIALSTVALLTLRTALADAQAQADALRDQAAILEQDNDRVQDKIDGLGSVDSVKDIAGEELDLVDPDSVIIEPEG